MAMTGQSAQPNFRIFIGLLAGVFLLLTALVAVSSLDADRRLADVNYDSSGIAAVQIRLHHTKLLEELALIENAAPTASAERALLQFDILYERVRSLPNRPPYTKILDDRAREMLSHIQDGLQAELPLFDAIASNGMASLIGTYDRLDDMESDINRFSGKTLELAVSFRKTSRNEIIQVTRLLIILTAGLALSGATFAFLLWRQVKRYEAQNETLRDIAEQLLAANNAKKVFLAHMSHELRTPLNAIMGFSETMATGHLGRMENAKHLEYARDIHLSARHLLDLINDILDISRIEAGEEVLTISNVELGNLVETSLVVADPRHDIETVVDIPADFPRLQGDRRRLQQILVNLIANADKHTAAGGRIEISAALEQRGIVLSVRDNGTGIAAEDIPIALMPFGQVRFSIDQAHEGTGLGLPLSQSLMELHDGTLVLESTPGHGTTVRLLFPASRTVAG